MHRPSLATASTSAPATLLPQSEAGALPRLGDLLNPSREAPPPSDSKSHEDGGDTIVFDPPVLDFGRVRAGSAVSEEVWVINASETAVTVLETHSTCGCTVAHLTERTIHPGDGIPVRVQLTVPRRDSSISKQVRFEFADGLPDHVLNVRAEAVEPVTLTPHVVRMGTTEPSKAVLESTDGSSFRVLGASPPVLAMPVEAIPAISHEIRIDELLWNSAGRPSRVDFVIDHPEVSSISLAVRPGSSSLPYSTSEVDRPRTVVSAPPSLRLSSDRLRFGDVSELGSRQLEVIVQGAFAPDVEPEFGFESAMADLRVVEVESGAEGIRVILSLIAKPNRNGYVRSDMRVQIGNASAICQIQAKVGSH